MQSNAQIDLQGEDASAMRASPPMLDPKQHRKDLLIREVDVGDLIDSRPLGLRQIVTLALCLLVTVLDGFDNQAIALLVAPMSRDLQITAAQFGMVFGSAAIGMILSAIVVGPLADRFGRKGLLVISTLFFGIGSVLTAGAHNLTELLALRFFTGIGLGGVLPNVIALAAEYSPRRMSRTCITVMVAGLPAGAMLGAATATALQGPYGWQATFYVGGVLPVLIALAIIAWMPESIRYLIASGASHERVLRLVRLVAPIDSYENVRFVSREFERASAQSNSRKASLRDIFTEGRARATTFLWITYLMNMMVVYFSISWLPSVILASGHPIGVSAAATAAFAAGGVIGSASQGALMNTLGSSRMLILQCVLAALYSLLLGTVSLSAVGIVVATGVAGYALVGVQAGLNALAAETYPTEIRATGTGWALGAGRMGSIIGPVLGGLMVGQHWPAQHIFLATAIPSVLAMGAIAMGRAGSTKPKEETRDAL